MNPVSEVVVTRVFERHQCYFVEGRVLKDGQYVDAAFTAYKPDVNHMTRDEFMEFSKRQLPHVTADIDWNKETH